MNYSEVLKVIENMMDRTGIREFCRTVCKGNCCKPCDVRSCFNGERKLACSAFICTELRYIINDLGERKASVTIAEVHAYLVRKLNKAYAHTADMYFKEVTARAKSTRFRANVINKLNKVYLPEDWKQGIVLKHERPYKVFWNLSQGNL